jgi:hypothetical protein
MPRRISALLVALALPTVLLWLLQAGVGQAQNSFRNRSDLVFAQWNFEDQTTNPNIDLTGNAAATGGTGLSNEAAIPGGRSMVQS